MSKSLCDIILATPELEYLPGGLFTFSLAKDSYPPAQRAFARMLLNKERPIIPALIKLDLELLRRVPQINPYTAKCFLFKKFFIAARDFSRITGFMTIKEALRFKYQPTRF